MSLANNALPTPLYTTQAVRAIERRAIDELGVPGIQLMNRAGAAALRLLQALWPAPSPVHVFCGTGNNGGDGFVLAALAQARNLKVSVWQVGDAGKIKGDALTARNLAVANGATIAPWDGVLPASGIIVDALLGTGLHGNVTPDFAQAIAAINASGLPVLALDVPSGLGSDSGARLGCAVAATHTLTFVAVKQGLLTGFAPECCGVLHCADLNLPASLLAQMPASATRLVALGLRQQWLPKRARAAHKGSFGHVLIIGGDHGAGGAVMMAAEASLRTGAGLVSCATRAEHVAPLLARSPEVMVHAVRARADLAPLLARASVVVVGPGLGQAAWGQQLLHAAVASDLPLIIDADALNLISSGTVAAKRREHWIFTPHPGEAARLLATCTEAVQSDRFAAARALQQRFGGAIVLKGAGTLVASAGGLGISNYGNPGMASGGMGDVLSGILGALLAQGLEVGAAASLGVCLHGLAGDRAAQAGERGLVATDLIACLREVCNL